jgi:hypothetical protein
MNHKEKSHRVKLVLVSILSLQLAAAWAMPWLAAAPSGHKNADDNGPIQVGYAIVTPTADSPSTDIAVFETFGERRGGQTQQAGVLPSAMTTHAVLFVNASGRLSRNVGVAIANPGPAEAGISMTLYDEEGGILADYESSAHPPLLPGAQTAKYVTELFESHPEVSRDFTGTLDITSDQPVAIIGIRSRGENFSTLPVTSLSGPSENSGAIILAHFAVGGGWTTEIVIANYGDKKAIVDVDLFDQSGGCLEAKLDDGPATCSFVKIEVAPHGVVTLAQKDENGDSGL